jgi:hypothetical protein
MAESPRGSVGVRRDSSNETCHERRKRSEGSKRLSWGGGCRDAEFGLESPKARQGSLTLSSFNDSPETETAKGHRRGLQKMWHKCALYVALVLWVCGVAFVVVAKASPTSKSQEL